MSTCHDGHRERMRERFLQNNGKGMHEHELLEMLLYFSIPRENTNAIAHELIEKCGSFRCVFESSYDELLSVKGIGRQSALLIRIVSMLIIAAVLFATVPEKKGVKLNEQSIESNNQTFAAQTGTEVLSENNTELPTPGSGDGKQLIDKGQNYIKVDYLGEGEVTYTVLSARTAENINDMDRCLLISFEIRNESVSKEFYENHIALANCFNLSDGSPWDNQNRFFAEPKYLDLAESKPTKDNKLYFRYDFPKIGESTMFTLGFDLSNEVRDLLKEDKLYLSYTLDEINIPLKSTHNDNVPENIMNFMHEYLENFNEGPEAIISYRYFPDEIEKNLLLENPIKIIDYRIADAEKINDSLYAFKLEIQNNGMPKNLRDEGKYTVIYNFVIKLDGQLYICANSNSIPAVLKENCDLSKYANPGQMYGETDGVQLIEPQIFG